jgi:hypothetical protein
LKEKIAATTGKNTIKKTIMPPKNAEKKGCGRRCTKVVNIKKM